MIKINKLKLILASIGIMLPSLVGVILWDKLPSEMATHFGPNGNADGFSSKAFAVFGLPLILLAVFWICMFFTLKDKKNANQDKKAFNMIFWLMPILSCIVNGVIYLIAFGKEINITFILALMLGLLFMFIGNYMPKCRQNATLGVKIRWTLQSEENWNVTHRFTGKVWFICGLITLLTVFLPLKVCFFIWPVTFFFSMVLPVIYSYVFYKKEVKNGTEFKSIISYKKVSLLATVICVVISGLAAVLMFTGDIAVDYTDNSFTIKADYYEDITVDYKDIDDIEYRENYSFGSRLLGFSSAKLLMGRFQNDEFKDYTLYAYTNSKTCVIITVDEKTLVIGLESAESTKEFYEKLIGKAVI